MGCGMIRLILKYGGYFAYVKFTAGSKVLYDRSV